MVIFEKTFRPFIYFIVINFKFAEDTIHQGGHPRQTLIVAQGPLVPYHIECNLFNLLKVFYQKIAKADANTWVNHSIHLINQNHSSNNLTTFNYFDVTLYGGACGNILNLEVYSCKTRGK
jgi:hypothetical protein